MAKGFFTQGVCILLARPVQIERIVEILSPFGNVRRLPESTEWAFSGPSCALAMRPEVNGQVIVDVVDRSWPDGMGDPKSDHMLFGAWSMGHFGPYTFPGGLERARQQSWSWPEAKQVVPTHKGFLRIRTTYVAGAKGSDPVMPKDYDPAAELMFVTKVLSTLRELEGAICYFNANGEVLKPLEAIQESLRRAAQSDVVPLDLWANIRLYNLDGGEWLMMDTVGMAQLDCCDHEACFPKDYDCSEIANFLRTASWHVCEKGPVIKDGDTMDGPGNVRWRARARPDSLLAPPREVLRWFPQDGSEPPALLTAPPKKS
jgi:hypothetical protein